MIDFPYGFEQGNLKETGLVALGSKRLPASNWASQRHSVLARIVASIYTKSARNLMEATTSESCHTHHIMWSDGMPQAPFLLLLR